MDTEIDAFKYARKVNANLRGNGLFLVSGGTGARPNVMTIGWGFLGVMWSRPVFVVGVRHSRHTFSLLESSGGFTVCIPARGMEKALDFCGTKSGRDSDKLRELTLTAKIGAKYPAPYIAECPVRFECETIFKTDMAPGQLAGRIEGEMYKTPDFHMLYFGEVKGCFEAPDAEGRVA